MLKVFMPGLSVVVLLELNIITIAARAMLAINREVVKAVVNDCGTDGGIMAETSVVRLHRRCPWVAPLLAS